MDCNVRSTKPTNIHCSYPSKQNLIPAEVAVLYLYILEADDDSFYRYFNEMLRDVDRKKAVRWFSFLRLFDSALSKLLIIRSCVWCDALHDVSNDYQKNKIVKWCNVSSCSSSVKIIRDFLEESEDSTLFMVEVVNGEDFIGCTINP